MKQLELKVDNTDDFLLANGYGKLQGMGQKLGARFGRLMLAHAKKSNMYREHKYRWPKRTGAYGNARPMTLDEAGRAAFIIREAADNGLTSSGPARAAVITRTAANKRIQRQVKNGYLRKFGRVYKPTGGTSNVYVLTDKGEKLLKEIGE